MLRLVKEPFEVWTKTLREAKFIIFTPVPPALVQDDSAGMIARELWWTNRDFSPVDIILS
jgi:hypothetical protein